MRTSANCRKRRGVYCNNRGRRDTYHQIYYVTVWVEITRPGEAPTPHLKNRLRPRWAFRSVAEHTGDSHELIMNDSLHSGFL